MIPSDKGGNYYLDRDPKTFRHIMAYLRFKKERCVASLGRENWRGKGAMTAVACTALPSNPDELAKLVGECEALNLVELREMALEMMQKYLRTEEQHYVGRGLLGGGQEGHLMLVRITGDQLCADEHARLRCVAV
jgi:hypothetical protein